MVPSRSCWNGTSALQPEEITSTGISFMCVLSIKVPIRKSLETYRMHLVYGAARKSYLRELETIHHLVLRIALEAFTTSPIESLYVEANEPPLSLRRYKLALQYYIKLTSCLKNPAYNCIMEIRYKNLFKNKEKVIKPFNLRIQTLLNEIKINPKIIIQSSPKQHHPIIKLDLTKHSKTKTLPITFQENFLNIQKTFQTTTTLIQMDPNRE